MSLIFFIFFFLAEPLIDLFTFIIWIMGFGHPQEEGLLELPFIHWQQLVELVLWVTPLEILF